MRGHVALLGIWAAACGEVAFVDPDAELKGQLRIEEALRLFVERDPRSYFFVRITSRVALDGVQLVALGPAGALELPWGEAERSDCGVDGAEQRCLALSLGPGLPDRLDELALIRADIGHRHEARLASVRLDAHEIVGEASDGNEGISVTVFDPVRAHFSDTEPSIFLRSFEAHVTPGACGTPPLPSSPAWVPTGPLAPALVPATFSAEPDALACLSVRPRLPLGGPAIAAVTVPAAAALERFTHVYQPPIERSPIVYRVLFDLEMPSEERCAAAQALVEGAILDAATEIAASNASAEVLVLPSVEIASQDGVRCRQSDLRTIDGAGLARETLAAVDEAFGPERGVRITFVYAQNLDLELPGPLADQMAALRAPFFRSPRLVYTVAIAPERASSSISVDTQVSWRTTQEPNFRDSIFAVLRSTWPFSTQLHSGTTVVPLAAESARDRYRAFRVCGVDRSLQAFGTPIANTSSFVPDPVLGPGYTVNLPSAELVPASTFGDMVRSVTVDWVGCRALCDRPAPGDRTGISWLMGGCP